jgi:hypothetical protein
MASDPDLEQSQITEKNCDNFLIEINALISHYRRPSNSQTANLTFLALLFSKRANKKPPFTWRYIYQLSRKILPPSKKISDAVDLEYYAIDKDALFPLETITVVAPRGLLPQGTLVTSVPKFCTLCGQSYVPRSNNQKYCLFCQRKIKPSTNKAMEGEQNG